MPISRWHRIRLALYVIEWWTVLRIIAVAVVIFALALVVLKIAGGEW